MADKDEDFKSPSLNTFAKYVNLFQGGNKFKTIVVLNGQEDSLVQQLKLKMPKNKFYRLKDVSSNATCAQNYQLVGSLSAYSLKSLSLFTNKISCFILSLIINSSVSVKIYIKYLLKKIKTKSKNIKIKQK